MASIDEQIGLCYQAIEFLTNTMNNLLSAQLNLTEVMTALNGAGPIGPLAVAMQRAQATDNEIGQQLAGLEMAKEQIQTFIAMVD